MSKGYTQDRTHFTQVIMILNIMSRCMTLPECHWKCCHKDTCSLSWNEFTFSLVQTRMVSRQNSRIAVGFGLLIQHFAKNTENFIRQFYLKINLICFGVLLRPQQLSVSRLSTPRVSRQTTIKGFCTLCEVLRDPPAERLFELSKKVLIFEFLAVDFSQCSY